MIPIIDLHCDLLHALTRHAGMTGHELALRCSLPHLRAGGMLAQVFAIFGYSGPDSAIEGPAQCERLCRLLAAEPAYVHNEAIDASAWTHGAPTVALVGIENASTCFADDEPFALGLARLEAIRQRIGRVVYVGLTWGHENRFGGGNDAPGVGLKDDGRRMLDYLAEHRIAIDLSHTSDTLAAHIFHYCATSALPPPILASHSGSRAMCNVPRNLPDELLRELFLRGGVLGMPWIRYFVGESPRDFVRHLDHLIDLGGAEHLACGADLFLDDDIIAAHRRSGADAYFFPEFQCASDYPAWLTMVRAAWGNDEQLVTALAYRNALRWLQSIQDSATS